jgi:protein-tyrosine-phosphatase
VSDKAVFILAVCTGNICRSPIAEGILAKRCSGGSVSAASAGTHALIGNPAAEYSVIAALEHGVDITRHRARPLTEILVRTSDIIICMEPSHVEYVLSMAPDAEDHVYNLGEFAEGIRGSMIPDPYGCGLREYRTCYLTIENAIDRLVRERLHLPGCAGPPRE